jgi:hypothetical protein
MGRGLPLAMEHRIDSADGRAYPLASFLEEYGHTEGHSRWAAAQVVGSAQQRSARQSRHTRRKRKCDDGPSATAPVDDPEGAATRVGSMRLPSGSYAAVMRACDTASLGSLSSTCRTCYELSRGMMVFRRCVPL